MDAGGLPFPNVSDRASEQILPGPYAVSSKLQPFELRLRLAFTGHFLLPSGASVRLTIVVICTAACSLFCSPRFRLAESRTAGASAPRFCMGTVTQITDLDSSARMTPRGDKPGKRSITAACWTDHHR